MLRGIIVCCPSIFVGPLEQLLGNIPIVQAMRVLPTYYIAAGVYDATQNQETWGDTLLNVTVILACTIILLAISTWMLRRQASVAAAL